MDRNATFAIIVAALTCIALTSIVARCSVDVSRIESICEGQGGKTRIDVRTVSQCEVRR